MTPFIHSVSKQSLVALVAIAMLISVATPARAQTIDQLQAQIAALMAQLSALQGGQSTAAAFTADMTIGASGAEVTRLQNWLISKGYSIPAGATGYFGAQTAAAVAAFQTANGITPAAGYFGPMTRAKVNASIIVTPAPNPGNDDTLSGGAGSVDSYTLISSLNNEEVGENEENVEVAGLEIEVDDGSDIRLTAVRVTFDEGTATRDFRRYADEVTLLLDGNEVARVDADTFTKRNNWSRVVSLDKDAVIRAGDTGELVVAISGIRNLDSADEGDTWTVDFEQVRFVDADGATITDNPGTNARTFSFEAFAKAANVELRISEDDDEVNESHVIEVHATNRTKNVDLLSFEMEVRGNSDIELDSLPVAFTVTGADHLDDMVSTVHVLVDGKKIASKNVPVDEDTIVFDKLDLTLDAGDSYEFMITGDFHAVSGALDEGDTIEATIGETETNSADFKAEDESGDDLGDSDIVGSATSGPHATYVNGLSVKFVSATQTVSYSADDAGEADQGTFNITFDVTAFGSDIRIDNSCTEDGVDAAGQGVEYTVMNAADNTSLCSLASSKTDSEDTSDTFEVDEDKTRRFTLTTIVTAEADNFAQVSLNSINWGTETDDTNDRYYTFDLSSFRTGVLYLNVI